MSGSHYQPNLELHPKKLKQQPLTIDPSALADPRAEPVTDKLYSGFIEHLGRGIYGGLVDNPNDPSPSSLLEAQPKGRLGWRKDVMKLIAKDGELEMPVLRWPGGNFVSNYHWQDGIGPLENRPKRIDLAWGDFESNLFGTDEFIDYCRAIKVEPYFCWNMGTGSLEEALAWLEYCNGTSDTYWANLRRKNTGRNEPHNVKYWGLGNEMWGPWQVNHLTATEYTLKAQRWAHAAKLVDPSIKLISCGKNGNSDWDREVLQGLIKEIDMHSIHFYSSLGYAKGGYKGNEYEVNVFSPNSVETGIDITASLISLAQILADEDKNGLGGSTKETSSRSVKICYDEWNVWDDAKVSGFGDGLEQKYDFTDMIAFVAWLNVLVRKSGVVGMACLAQTVNVIAPILATPKGLVRQTLFYPLALFGKYMKDGHLLNLSRISDVYTGPTWPLWQQPINAPSYIDLVGIVADKDGGKSIRLSVINRHPADDWKADFRFVDFAIESVEHHEIYSDDLDAIVSLIPNAALPNAHSGPTQNTEEKPDTITPTVKTYSAKEWESANLSVKKHSFSFFIFKGQ